MILALIRTTVIVAVILVAVQLLPALAPYESVLLVLALISGLFGFVARSLFALLLVAAAIAAYFFFLH